MALSNKPESGGCGARLRGRALFSSLFLSTGAALLAYIVSGVSLLATACVALALAGLIGALLWRRMTGSGQLAMRRTLGIGDVSGILATLAYDLCRFLLIELTGIAFWPFDIFTIFGQALVGAGFEGWWVQVAGFAYHLANGVGLALSYTILFGRRGVAAGVAWALALEVLMVSVYPGWLDLRALDEFLQVSIVGHLAYGTVLGYAAKKFSQEKKGTGS